MLAGRVLAHRTLRHHAAVDKLAAVAADMLAAVDTSKQ
jgi:hypothetical protein